MLRKEWRTDSTLHEATAERGALRIRHGRDGTDSTGHSSRSVWQ